MKKFFLRLLLVIVFLIAALLITALFVKKEYSIVRSVQMETPKKVVYEYMADFSNFSKWSPWAEMDPDMKVEITGEKGAVGSLYIWEGNDDVGKGKMEIIRLTDDSIVIRLNFIEPFENEDITYYVISDEGEGTKVEWGMQGSSPYPFNLMMFVMGMEKQVGTDFENGLGKLKKELAGLKAIKGDFEIEEIDFEPRYFIGKRDTLMFSEMGAFYSNNLGDIYAGILERGYEFKGAPSGLFFSWDEENDRTDMAAAVPITQERSIGNFETWKLGGKALRIVYFGDYEGSVKAHMAMDKYIEEHKLQVKMPVIEEYVTDPMTEPDTSKWQTNIFYLVE